jgi:hypothetical protein
MNILKIFLLSWRLKKALKNFKKSATPEQSDAAHRVIDLHSDALFENREGKLRVSEFSLVKSVLENRVDKRLKEFGNTLATLRKEIEGVAKEKGHEVEPELFIRVLPDGEILGSGKYESLDLSWVEAFIVWLENYFHTRKFPQPGPWITIPDRANIAVFGDWGGGCWRGNSVAASISRSIVSLKPDYSVHLGDVYYAGESKQEKKFLLSLWPSASKGNFTLNSNHEMYPIARGYFDVALKNPLFALQQGKSFFALENSNWIIVGLDSAFHSDRDGLYLQGVIDGVQADFLAEVASKNKPTIVMCHHDPVDLTGTVKNPLWNQVYGILKNNLKYWYWGHTHAGAVYREINGVKCRLNGHGVVPWGNSTTLQKSMGSSVIWYEKSPPLPADGPRVQNGFALLSMDGPNVKETFYGEDGRPHWSS